MKYNISKELFEAVYNCDITTDKDMLGAYRRINIYEFAFKCKEWAYKNKYDIWSITWGVVEFQNNEKNYGTKRITKDTEIEAIIKACEYILKELSNK